MSCDFKPKIVSYIDRRSMNTEANRKQKSVKTKGIELFTVWLFRIKKMDFDPQDFKKQFFWGFKILLKNVLYVCT